MRFAKHPKEQEVIEADNAGMEELRNIEGDLDTYNGRKIF